MKSLELAVLFVAANLLPALAVSFYITRDKAKAGLIDKLILAVILSPLFLVILSFVEDALGIPQSSPVLLANICVLAAGNLYFMVRRFSGKANFSLQLSWAKGLAYGLFVALVLFRVLPTFDLLAPILHDPISHSEWLKLLATTHTTTTEQWYPQGLEYYLNYYASFLDYSYPQIVLVGTNFLLALFPVSMFYLGLLSFSHRDRWLILPLIMMAVAARLAYPNDFYFMAGKNSMIFAFAMIPLLLYMGTTARSRVDYAVMTALSFATILIHYPTGFFVLFIFLFANLANLVRRGGNGIGIEKRVLTDYLISGAVLAGLGALLLKKIVPIYMNHPIGEDRSFDPVVNLIKSSGILAYVYRHFLDEQLQVFRTPWVYLFVASLSAFLLIPAGNKAFVKKLVAAFAALYVIGVAMLMVSLSVGINYNVEIRFFLSIVYVIVISWFLYYLLGRYVFTYVSSESRREVTGAVIMLVLAAVFLQGGLSQFRLFKTTQSNIETVRQEDLDAFSFIDANLDGGGRFLIQLGAPSGNTAIIAGADSGVWIPSFTDSKVEVSFLDFSSDRSHEVFELYLDLAKNGNDGGTVSRLYCDYDIGYVFFGSRLVFFNNMKKETLEESRYFEKIFDNGATIFRIRPIECG